MSMTVFRLLSSLATTRSSPSNTQILLCGLSHPNTGHPTPNTNHLTMFATACNIPGVWLPLLRCLRQELGDPRLWELPGQNGRLEIPLLPLDPLSHLFVALWNELFPATCAPVTGPPCPATGEFLKKRLSVTLQFVVPSIPPASSRMTRCSGRWSHAWNPTPLDGNELLPRMTRTLCPSMPSRPMLSPIWRDVPSLLPL